MSWVDEVSKAPKLSICIATFNRAGFIGETLSSVFRQITDECEVVILDGGSTDDTERVVTTYVQRYRQLSYVRLATNSGIDRDYDRAVEMASGKYCWLMSDDDLVKPGAIATILRGLRPSVSVVVLNVESRDVSMGRVLQRRWLEFEAPRTYGPQELDRLFVEAGDVLQYVGSFIVSRSLWLERDRKRYYGSMFIHVGVVFQQPLPGDTLLLAEPVISYRMGNSRSFASEVFELHYVKWPAFVRSLPLSDWAKRAVCSEAPWRDLHRLVLSRAQGIYSLKEYQEWLRPQLPPGSERFWPLLVAMLPGILVNAILVLYYSISSRSYQGMSAEVWLQFLGESRFHVRNLLLSLADSLRKPSSAPR